MPRHRTGPVPPRPPELPTDEDLRLWRAVMHDVRPLPGRALPIPASAAPIPAPLPPVPPKAMPTPPRLVPPSAGAPAPRPTRLTEGKHATVPGLDRRSTQRLKRGQLPIEARLDLHGMTREAAHAALNLFLRFSQHEGRRAVLVITGKGGAGDSGVLRRAVPRWLHEGGNRERVLAYTSARPQHGGEGAIYVLLRRQRP